MDNLIVPLIILFFIGTSIADAIRKARLKQRMDADRPIGGEGEWRAEDEESDDAQIPPFLQPPSAAPQGRAQAPRREESPEEAIRRLFMGEAAPPPPPPRQAPQPVRPPAPRPQATPERTPQSGLDRIGQTRDLRGEQTRKSEAQKYARTQATRDAKAKAQRGEDRFRQEALRKERKQTQRMEQVRETYRRAKAPDVALTRLKTAGSDVSRLSRANLRDALIFNEILQPPLALRRRRADRRAR